MDIKEFIHIIMADHETKQWQKDFIWWYLTQGPVTTTLVKSRFYWDYETILINAYNHMKDAEKGIFEYNKEIGGIE